MKKNWNDPELKNLEIMATETDYIDAEEVNEASALDITGEETGSDCRWRWRWRCTCCNAKGTISHPTRSTAIEAGKEEHAIHANGCSA